MARVAYRAVALDALAGGAGADEAVLACTAPDADRDHRQLGVVGVSSQATWTGDSCLDWAGGVCGREKSGGYAIQGNILTGPDVVSEMEAAWLASAGSALTDRLIAALLAGDAAGGDSRGRQGAALYAVQPGAGYDHCGVLADLRVDDHEDAPQELARLLRMNDLIFGAPEDVEPLSGALADEVAIRLSHLGYSGETSGALTAWAGEANYEMRMSPDGIDAKVLEALRDATPDA
jgi:uncharacterized Ntn-hydrolase superfamily protein